MDPFDFESFRRLQQEYSDYLRASGLDSVQRAIDESRRLYESFSPPQAMYEQVSPLVQAAIEQARRQDDFLKSVGVIPDLLSQLAKQYGELYGRSELLSTLEQLDALVYVPTETRAVLEEIERIRQQLAHLGFTRRPRRAARKRAARGTRRSAEKDAVQRAREWLFGLIIPLILALHDTAARDEMERRLANKIDAVEAKIEEQRVEEAQAKERQRQMEALLVRALTALQRMEASRVQMIVRDRLVPIRQSPERSGHIVARLPRETVVELIDVQHEWIEVKYADPATKASCTGWAPRRYFRRVIPSTGTTQ